MNKTRASLPLSGDSAAIGPSGVRHESFTFSRLRDSHANSATAHVPITIWRDNADRISGNENVHVDFFGLYIARRGRGVHRLIDTRLIETTSPSDFQVARGDVYVMAPGRAHRYVDSQGLELDAVHFQLDAFDDQTRAILLANVNLSDLLSGIRRLRLTPGSHASVDTILAEMDGFWRGGGADDALLLRANLLRLLFLLARFCGDAPVSAAPLASAPARAGAEAIVADAVGFMESRFALGGMRIDAVAAHVGLSPDRFTEVFANVMGRTPRDYFRHLRVERAVSRLKDSDDTLARIAADCGFADAAHLARTVRAATGKPPRAFRGHSS